MSRKKRSTAVVGGFATAVFLANSAAFGESGGLPLADMIREIKVALLRVQEKAEARNLPPLSSAVLDVNTIQEIGGEGSVKFLVVEVGGGPTTNSTTEVEITLVPPPPGSGTDVANLQFADRLADVILASAKSLAEAGQGKPPLNVSSVRVAVKFGLIRTANGGVSLEFPPFEFKAGAKIKASEIQTVTVTYAGNTKK